MDEFLYIVNNTLENYLSSDILDKCDIVKINWAISRDNDLPFMARGLNSKGLNHHILNRNLLKVL